MKKDLILAKDYDNYRTAKPKKNKEYYKNLSDKEEKDLSKKENNTSVETSDDVLLPLGATSGPKSSK